MIGIISNKDLCIVIFKNNIISNSNGNDNGGFYTKFKYKFIFKVFYTVNLVLLYLILIKFKILHHKKGVIKKQNSILNTFI